MMHRMALDKAAEEKARAEIEAAMKALAEAPPRLGRGEKYFA
jgi:hypothetical protein